MSTTQKSMKKTVIAKFAHTDADLWPRLGPIVTSREVAKELGAPVYSSENTTWFLALQRGEVVGIAAVRETPTGTWMDAAWVAPAHRGQGIHAQLCAARDEFVRERGASTLLMCCRAARWRHYSSRGWTVRSRRGSWVYGAKTCA